MHGQEKAQKTTQMELLDTQFIYAYVYIQNIHVSRNRIMYYIFSILTYIM